MTRRALVTGAAGFIGTHVCRLLDERGFAVARVGGGWKSDPISLDSLSALDAEVSLVVHCAGGSSVGQSVADPHSDFLRTVPPVAALLERARTHAPAARIVLLSSAAVYGNAAVMPIAETTPLHPISPYGFHKCMIEQLGDEYGRVFGLSIAVVRLFSVYGPGLRKQLFWDAFHKARAGDVRFSGSGNELRDWLHAGDAAALILRAGEAASPSVPRFNGGAGQGILVKDAVARIFIEAQAPPPEFVGSSRPGDPERYVADISAALSLGWRPQVTLERGIHEYVRWLRENR